MEGKNFHVTMPSQAARLEARALFGTPEIIANGRALGGTTIAMRLRLLENGGDAAGESGQSRLGGKRLIGMEDRRLGERAIDSD